jgi:hypothetical protein
VATGSTGDLKKFENLKTREDAGATKPKKPKKLSTIFYLGH